MPKPFTLSLLSSFLFFRAGVNYILAIGKSQEDHPPLFCLLFRHKAISEPALLTKILISFSHNKLFLFLFKTFYFLAISTGMFSAYAFTKSWEISGRAQLSLRTSAARSLRKYNRRARLLVKQSFSRRFSENTLCFVIITE